MFFLLRCAFWLTVVFMHLPAGVGGDVSTGALLDMASARVGAFTHTGGDEIARRTAEAVAARVADDGAAWCQAHGEACADAVLSAMVAKTAMVSKTAAPASVDTLTAADRASRWRSPRRS